MTDHPAPPKPERVLRRLLLTLLAAFGTVYTLSILACNSYAILTEFPIFAFRPSVSSILLLFLSLPMMLLAPVAGAIADSSLRKPVMLGVAGGMLAMMASVMLSKSAPLLGILGVFAPAACVYLVALWTVTGELLAKTRWSPVIYQSLFGLVCVGAVACGFVSIGLDYGYHGLKAMIGVTLITLFLPGNSHATRDRKSLFANFLRGGRSLVRNRVALGTFLGLTLQTIVVFGFPMWVLNAETFLETEEGQPGVQWLSANQHARECLFAYVIALGIGHLFGLLQRNPFRVGMLVLYGNFAALIAMFVGVSSGFSQPVAVVLGLSLGAAGTGLMSYFRIWSGHLSPGIAGCWAIWARGFGIACLGLIAALEVEPGVTKVGALVVPTRNPDILHRHAMIVLGTLVFSAIWSCLYTLRATLEGTAEAVMLPVYRIRMKLAGDYKLPLRGPCLVIANHAAWFDPLWLGKVVPFPTTPMMTSSFYDLPVIRLLMKIVGTIRVPEATMRKEAPELQLAIDALDRGECVVIFPEGYLRRKEEVELRRFGRGVWHILSQRPATPVYSFWVEGGWGSYVSYKGGPPTKNKKIDFWRRVRIGGIPPVVVDPEILKDHITTRFYLMEKVAEARGPIGLPPLAIARPTSTGDDE
jgi:1-acyl-sn-glycerol-3-phosphate acyltransferase